MTLLFPEASTFSQCLLCTGHYARCQGTAVTSLPWTHVEGKNQEPPLNMLHKRQDSHGSGSKSCFAVYDMAFCREPRFPLPHTR